MQLCFLDSETTGLDHVTHPIFEIGLIVRDDVPFAPGQQDTEHRWTFNPGRQLAMADPVALRLNHYFERAVDLPVVEGVARYWIDGVEQESPLVKQALWEIAQLTAGRHFVGANPTFDAERLDTMLREHGLCPAWHYHLIDVKAMAIGWLAGRGRRLDKVVGGNGWDSWRLAQAIGVQRFELDAHTALADARWARDMYDAVVRGRRVVVSEAL